MKPMVPFFILGI